MKPVREAEREQQASVRCWRRGRERIALAAFAAIQLLVLACGTTVVDPPLRPGLSRDVREYLRPPLDGYRESVSPEWRAQLESAYLAMVEEGAVDAARAAGEALLRRSAGLTPAAVLVAQVDFVAGDHRAVVERLSETLADGRGYRAGQLLLGRAGELVGEPALAYRSYLAATGDPTADRRAKVVAEAAAQSVMAQLDDALARGRLLEARQRSEELASWAPGSRLALEGRWRVAAASSFVEELDAIRLLAVEAPDERAVVERLAELEVEVGDPKAGVDLYEELNRRYPREPDLADRLASAKFRWRLEMFPEEVLSLIGPKELTRGDFATLLYWMIPGIRSGRTQSARIAIDVPLGHPQREAIVRVLNLGLLEVADETLHRFAPNRPITRGEAFGSLVGWLAGEVSCAAAMVRNPSPSAATICDSAAACGLVRERADCLAQATLLGLEAREAIRRTLDIAGSP